MSISIGAKFYYGLILILIVTIIFWYSSSLILDWLILSNKYEATNNNVYVASKWTIRVMGWISMIIGIINGITGVTSIIDLILT